MKLVVFTICKNESKTLADLLDRIPKKIEGISTIETLVISDGSTDDTVKIANKKATKVIGGRKQKRLAYRFAQALETVLEMGADYAVNIDGDLQFAPEDIPKLVEPVVAGEADFVAADRFTDPETGQRRRPENMPKGKYLANRLGSYIVGSLSKESFRDVTCGFRAYSKQTMMAININSNYTYTQESFQVLALKKFTIKSMPIDVKYYPGRKSRVVSSFWQFLFGSALNILRAYRDYAPLRFFGTLSTICLFVGAITGGFVARHWMVQGSISPYISVGIFALFFVTLGIVFALIGLVTDMFDRMINNQEKILEELKIARYSSSDK